MAAQLINRKVYDDQGNLLRSGLVPKDLENTRAALMAYWEQQDRLEAEREAKAAAAAAAALQEPAGPSADELLAPVLERLEAAEAAVAGLTGLQQATPAAVLEGTLQIARAAGAAGLVEAAALTAVAQVDGVAAAADARLGEIEGQVNATAEAVGQLLTDARQSLDATQAEMLSKTTAAIAKRITALEVQAAQLRGPKGDRGRIGQGLIAGAGKRPDRRPDGTDWAPGDSWLDTRAEGFELSYLDAGGQWSKPARLVPAPKLVSAVQNVLDNSTKSTVVQTKETVTVFRGSAGGEGGLPLLRTDVATSWQPIAIGYNRGDLPLATDPAEQKAAYHKPLGDVRGAHFHLLVRNDATLDSRFVSGTIFLDAVGIENVCYYDDRATNNGDDFDLEVTLVRVGDIPVAATDNFPGGTAGQWELRARIAQHRVTGGVFGLSGRIVPLREKP